MEVYSADGTHGTLDALVITDGTAWVYNLTVDEAHTYFVGDGQWLVHNCPPTRRVLILGEEDNYDYARKLAEAHPDWEIYATGYGNGSNSQDFVESVGNLHIYNNVDSTRLHEGAFTQGQLFDDIVFNGPRAIKGWQLEAGNLVEDTLRSITMNNVLRKGGNVRFSSTYKMPAGARLGQLVRGRSWDAEKRNLPNPLDFFTGTQRRFFNDIDFGLSNYVHYQTGGHPSGITMNNASWYIFELR